MKIVSSIMMFVFALGIFFTSCGDKNVLNQNRDSAVTTPHEDRVLTEAERDALSPEDIVQDFKEGNQRFLNNDVTVRNHQYRVRQTAVAQFPKAVVLSCVDSRVPVEDIFDQGLGDLFVGRIAGNFADEEMLGSLEFATKVSGSKLVVVLGHQNCGAIKSAIDNVELGNITAMLQYIEPAIEMTTNFPESQRTVKNNDYVQEVVINNVHHTVEDIRRNSPIMAEMEKNGEIGIVGAYYNLEEGDVKFLEQ